MSEEKMTGRHDAIRTGVSVSVAGRDRINELCDALGVSQGGLLEATAFFVDEKVLAAAVERFKGVKAKRAESRSEARAALANLDDAEVRRLIEAARGRS